MHFLDNLYFDLGFLCTWNAVHYDFLLLYLISALLLTYNKVIMNRACHQKIEGLNSHKGESVEID